MASIFKHKPTGKTIRPDKSWKDERGVLHASNWQIWDADYKTSMGIVEIVLESPPDSRLYNWSHKDDGTINKTAKALTDVNSVDRDGKPVLDADGNQRITWGVKSLLKQAVKKQQGSLLSQTDWAVIRKADKGTAIPSNIQTWRDAIRTKATEMETAIDNASNTAAIEALFVAYDKDGKKTGILYDWPVLGS